MISRANVLLAVSVLVLTSCGGDAGPSSERLTLQPFGSVEGAPRGYAEYLPPGYGDGKPRPLLLFFHGGGNNGDGSEEALGELFNTAIPALIQNDSWPADRPFIVLMPQHSVDQGVFCTDASEIESFIAFALKHYDVDARRVYLTGLSCGAHGVWEYLGLWIDQVVAAAVPIAGDGNVALDYAGCDLGRVPIWAFHGALDAVVPPIGSVRPISELRTCTDPAPPVDARLTVYADADHNSWEPTYDLTAGHDIYEWMLGHEHP